MTKPLPVFFSLCCLLGASPCAAVTADGNEHTQFTPPSELAKSIRTLMCASESCDGADENTPGCEAYVTPLNACYNAGVLFPGDNSWDEHDVYDDMVMRSMRRTFYPSTDGRCAGWGGEGEERSDDSFILPLDVCVGPFGPPRPWGKFTLLFDYDDVRVDVAVSSATR